MGGVYKEGRGMKVVIDIYGSETLKVNTLILRKICYLVQFSCIYLNIAC